MGITIQNNRIRIFNDYLYREIDILEGPVTTKYNIRPNGKERGDVWCPMFTFESAIPFEAAVEINGVSYEAGPWRHIKNWKREGAFKVTSAEKFETSLGEGLRLYCTARNDQTLQLDLIIQYEIANNLPLLTKYVKIVNRSSSTIIVDNVTVDMLKMFNGKLELNVFSDYYWNIQKDDDYYKGFTRLEFPESIGMELKPGESFETFKCHEAVTSSDRDEAAITLHRIYKKIAPWITAPLIKQVVSSCNTYQELVEVADEAANSGIEMIELFVGQLFTNTGDYIPRPDLFPNGEHDLKKLVAYYHSKNLVVLPYCSTTIAWPDSKVYQMYEDWQYLGPDGIRYNPYGLGNMCYQSAWGEFISGKLLYLLDEIGFDGLGIDGPYHGLSCLATDHNHRTPQCVAFMNWMWEKAFFGEVIKRKKFITAPQEMEALFLGVHQRPGGYREEDMQTMGGMDFVTQTRAFMYDSRFKDPSCATWASCNLENYHGKNIEPSEENTATYDHALGGMFGYGHSGVLYGKKLYIGENTKKIYEKWLEFYKKYRRTLAGEMVHLSKPNGYGPDAVMHVSTEADPPAVVVIFNPTNKEASIALELHLRYAGFKPGSTASIEHHGSINLDSRGHGLISTALKGYEIKIFEISRSNDPKEGEHNQLNKETFFTL